MFGCLLHYKSVKTKSIFPELLYEGISEIERHHMVDSATAAPQTRSIKPSLNKDTLVLVFQWDSTSFITLKTTIDLFYVNGHELPNIQNIFL